MKKTLIFKALIIVPFLALNSCQNDINESIDETTPKELSTSKYTEEELLQKGWKLVDVIKLDGSSTNATNSKLSNYSSQAITAINLNKAHLRDIGYDINTTAGKTALKNAFAIYGVSADGVWLNSDLMIDANTSNNSGPQPNVKIEMSAPNVSNKNDSSLPDEHFTTYAENRGNKDAEITVKYSYKEGYKTTWSRKVMGSLKVGAKAAVKIPLIGKGEVSSEITVGGELGDGGDTSTEITKEASYKVIVPPRSKVSVQVFTKIKATTVDYTVPYKLSGFARTNYADKVAGHYFWAGDLNFYSNFKPYIKSEMGSAKAINYVEVHVVSSPAQPI